jgi:hypothetical protein
MIECPDVNVFAAEFPGAVVNRLSDLPVHVFSKGGHLLINQAITSLTPMEGGLTHRNGTKTAAP